MSASRCSTTLRCKVTTKTEAECRGVQSRPKKVDFPYKPTTDPTTRTLYNSNQDPAPCKLHNLHDTRTVARTDGRCEEEDRGPLLARSLTGTSLRFPCRRILSQRVQLHVACAVSVCGIHCYQGNTVMESTSLRMSVVSR